MAFRVFARMEFRFHSERLARVGSADFVPRTQYLLLYGELSLHRSTIPLYLPLESRAIARYP